MNIETVNDKDFASCFLLDLLQLRFVGMHPGRSLLSTREALVLGTATCHFAWHEGKVALKAHDIFI